jgi:photosystem II stability/assembly factor-like uncharacterized protein
MIPFIRISRVLSGTGLVAALLIGTTAFHPVPVAAENPRQAPSHDEAFVSVLRGLPVRSIGPANMSGRITDVAVAASDPKTIFVATANGGVWKTMDGGERWEPVFDDQDTLAIGAVAVAPSNPMVVYVGTGEPNPRNSVSWGKGIYRSRDGGQTWTFAGLPDAGHVGRIVVHPINPNVLYAAVLGRFWGPNSERGLYKSTDGGQTWTASQFLDEDTGFVDVAMDPSDPDTLYAAAYPVRRDAFAGGAPKMQWGPKGGLYKTSDGGRSWTKMTGGLPDRPCGRCGLSIYRKDPRILYAIVQTDRTAGPTDNRGQVARANTGDVEKGGIFRSEDRGETWKKVNDLVPRPFYYGQIRVDPNDDQRIYVLGVQFAVSSDGGKTFATGARGTHADHHALWINPANSDEMVLGNDGGLYLSKDRGRTWEPQRQIVVGQFYGVAVDMRRPYRVYGGLQDNGSWGGPSATYRADGITLADWFRVGGGDGFQAAVDPADHETVYVESQYGNLRRVSVRDQTPKASKGQKGQRGPASKAIRPRTQKGAAAVRYNWNSPIQLSPHNSKTLYYAGNKVFKSIDRGDTWKAISDDLTRARPGERTTGNTITAIAESPVKAGILYAGTDDGNLHVTQDDGKTWTDLTKSIPGTPADRWITRVECSHFDAGTAYLTLNRYRNDDRRPYVFRTTDFGKTWTSLVSNLPPDAPVHVIRESSRNRDLLFVGTEHGLFTSPDGGAVWHRVTNGLPVAVTVHDLVIHLRDRELLVGTHGRSVYVIDVAPLEELTAEIAGSPAHLFAVKPAVAYKIQPAGEPTKAFAAPNPPYGAVLAYRVADPATLTIEDENGKVLAQWAVGDRPGFNRIVWDLGVKSETGPVAPGTYRATLKTARGSRSQPVRVLPETEPLIGSD